MNLKKRILLYALFIFGVISLTGSISLISYELVLLGALLALTGSIIIFITLLEARQDRFMKGMSLIAFGVLFQVLYPIFLYILVDKETIPQFYQKQLEIYGLVILLACSGAGGSIIANYADEKTIDFEKEKPINTNHTDITKDIRLLVQNTAKLNKKLNITITTCAISLATTSLLLLAWLLK